MGIPVGEIFDEATIAALKTYLGTDEKLDLTPALSEIYDLRSQDFNRLLAGLSEVAFRIRFGMFVALPFSHPNVAASQTNLEIYRGSGADVALLRTVAPFDGSMVGITARTENARTAGQCAVHPSLNGAVKNLEALIDVTNTQKHYATQLPQVETFSAGDELGVMLTTDGTWAAGATPSLDVDLYVSFRDQ